MIYTEINCKELFQEAYEKRYVWNAEFRGYKGKCICSANNESYEVDFH